MPVPSPDLRLDEAGMSCTLSFNRAPFHCVVPWGSVYAMVGDDGRGMVWPDDVPPEVEQQARGREGEAVAAKKGTVKRAPDAEARGREAAMGERLTPEAGIPRQAAGAISKPKKPRKKGRADAADSVGAPNGVDVAESPARANLVAVPAIPIRKESPAISPPLVQRAPKAEGQRPTPRIVSGDRRPNAAPRAKRELPPYLRVVK
jgi:hypothetical protein